MAMINFDPVKRGRSEIKRAKPLQPRHPAAVRQEMMRKEAEHQRSNTLRVKAKNDLIAKFIFHPIGHRTFKDGYADWPNDSFTRNRIRDGDVTVEKAAHEERKTEPQRNTAAKPARQHEPPQTTQS